MVQNEHKLTLDEFEQRVADSLRRINEDDCAEVITVNGKAEGILLSPRLYEALLNDADFAHSVRQIQRSAKEFDEGKGIPAEQVFDELRREAADAE